MQNNRLLLIILGALLLATTMAYREWLYRPHPPPAQLTQVDRLGGRVNDLEVTVRRMEAELAQAYQLLAELRNIPKGSMLPHQHTGQVLPRGMQPMTPGMHGLQMQR